jgi:hypothetical protein
VAVGADDVLQRLDRTARALVVGEPPTTSAGAVASAAVPVWPAVRSGAWPADLDLLHPTDASATVERVTRLLDRMTSRPPAPAPAPLLLPSPEATTPGLALSSVLKKRKKKMNKHKYKKRLKMTRALRKSLNK